MGEYTGSEVGLHPMDDAMDQAQQKLSHVKQQAQQGLERVKAQAGQLEAQTRESLERADSTIQGFARSNPLAAVAGAVVAGFIMGRLASKI